MQQIIRQRRQGVRRSIGIERNQPQLPQSKQTAILLVKPSAAWKLVDDQLKSSLNVRCMSS